MKVVASIGPISIGAVVTDNWRYTIRESFMMTYGICRSGEKKVLYSGLLAVGFLY